MMTVWFFLYKEKDDEWRIKYGTTDDVDDVADFYKDLFKKADYIVTDEKEDKDKYSVEGITDNYGFEIEIEEASGDEADFFDTTVDITVESLTNETDIVNEEYTEAFQYIVVEREDESENLQTANEATALALRYYIYARLKTEELIEVDFESLSLDEARNMMDELVYIWETANILTSGAEVITNQAILKLEVDYFDQMTISNQSQAQVITLYAKTQDYAANPLSDNTGDVVDKQTWAENLTKQYDALRGAQRYKQLAQQLGTDTKTAVEQMALAQKIIHNAADLEEAQAVSAEYNRCVNTLQVYKTGSKVGLFIGATVATGGGSLASLAGSSFSAAQAGTIIVGGVDCIVDVGTTASTIVLGEDHQVTVDFQKAGDVLQPASMVMGLITMNPSEPIEQIAFIGEAVMEWFVPGKYTGMTIERVKAGGSRLVAKLISSVDEDIPGSKDAVEKALETIGLSFPSEKNVTLEKLLIAYTSNSQMSVANMKELAAQIGIEDWEVPSTDLELQEVEPEDTDSSDTPSQENSVSPMTASEMAGTYSESAVLTHVEEGVEAPDSLPVTLQLNADGTGTVNVSGFSGDAQYSSNTVVFSVTMEEDESTILCAFEGSVSKSGSQIVISGEIDFSMMGISFASYSWIAQK